MRIATLLACLVPLLAAGPAGAEEFVVAQKNKKFSASELKAKVGDVITFKNDDPFFHNIFSLSEAQSFDLGTHAQGQSRKVTLNNPGKVEIECAIHPEMKLTVDVAK